MSTSTSTSTSTSAADAMRAKQAPLKSKYREDPSSALITLTSTGSLDPTTLTCSLGSSAATASKRIAGMHAAAGGTAGTSAPDLSAELCSGDLLLESLVACFGVTIRAVGTSMGIALTGGSVTAEGDLDFRGTLGIKDAHGGNVGVGFQSIRLRTELELVDEESDQGKVEKLMQLSERYCVVLQTLRGGVGVESEVQCGGGKSGATDAGKQNDKATGDEEATEAEKPDDENVLKLN